ncbi:PAS domain-containing protein [Hyphococcus sp.]|uniref:PAS domain-containing protein n=1 Tax=Hyphococcus sp. TaxID=2038636 RepID=UPI003CCBAF0D
MPKTSKRTEKIQISLAPEEIEQIDKWQFDNRMPTRAAAIRELIGRSINTEATMSEARVTSREIGVLESKVTREGPPSFTIADARSPDMPLIYVSPGFTDLCEYANKEVVGKNCRFLQGAKTDPDTTAKIRKALDAGEPIETELVNYRKSGSAYRLKLNIEPIFRKDEKSPILFVGVQTLIGDL